MAHILIAWELGEAFGHLARCLQLAEALRQRGHLVALALKDLRLPVGHATMQGMTVLQAPLTPQQGPAHRRMPVNYADVLNHCGFADAQEVSARLRAWQGIFSLARPDLLIADHAPTALLAAHLADIPHLAIGNGFAIPPAISPWPSIRPWETISDETLWVAEQRLDRVTKAAQMALGHAKPVSLRKLFGNPHSLDTFAELDHYGERPDGHYIGPIVSIPQARLVNWQERKSRKVIAYLRPEVPGFTMIMQALAHLDAEVLCVTPGLLPDMARRLATRRLRIALAPVDLSPLLRVADLAVSYGSSGFVTQALLAGVPIALRPRHVEQALLARRVETMGAGKLLDSQIDEEAVAASLQAILHSYAHREAAYAFRDRYRDFSPEQAIERALNLVEQTLLEGMSSDRTHAS
jgi:UDP:flavonoid glycosyltransferase YjiC (YdhE family)